MKLNDVRNSARHKWMGNYALKSDKSQIMPGTWGIVKEGVFIREEDGARAKLRYEDVKHVRVERLKEGIKRPRQPRGGHYVVERDADGNRRARKVATAGKGYVYIDTGRIDRDVIPMSDLEYIGHGAKGHMWKEKV